MSDNHEQAFRIRAAMDALDLPLFDKLAVKLPPENRAELRKSLLLELKEKAERDAEGKD